MRRLPTRLEQGRCGVSDENHYALGPGPDWTPLAGDAAEHRDPEVQARINARGSMLVREALASLGLDRDQTFVVGTPNCETHPEQRGGATPAGDAYCPDCRRAGRGQTTTKESDR